MLDLPIGRLFWTFQRLAAISQTLTGAMGQGIKWADFSEYDFDELLRNADEFSSLCLAATLNVTHEASKVVCADLRSAVKIGDMHRLEWGPFIRSETSLKQLIGCLRYEAATKVAMLLPEDKLYLFSPPAPLFGADIRTKFPSAIYDIDEAAKCIAVGRATASVFHAMRIVEIALVAIAKRLGVTPPNNPNWGAWLKPISDEIRARGPRWPDKEFFQDLYQRLDAIKDAQRNPTLHIETTHDEAEARLIFANTEGLLKKIAAKMDENGQDLTWLDT